MKTPPLPDPSWASIQTLHGHPFNGFAWRGAELTGAEIAAYTPGRLLKHLGEARARLDQPRDFPVLFHIRVRAAWQVPGSSDVILFPPDAVFRVGEIQTLPGGRLAIELGQLETGSEGCAEPDPEFHRWVAAVPTTLPKPTLALKRAWNHPFARWHVGAVPGDEPLVGVVYDFHEAVRFAALWTGLETSVVAPILEAKGRYLQLAGIAGCELDEALLREREAMQQYLPDSSTLQETCEAAYVARVTGLGEDVVLQVSQADTAYLDSLGLITWVGDGDPDGGPEPQDPVVSEVDPDDWEGDECGGSFYMEGGPMEEGHERHWAAVHPEAQEARKSCPAPARTQKHIHWKACLPDEPWELLTAVAIPAGKNLELRIIQGIRGEDREQIAAFPCIRDGNAFRLQLHHPRVWRNGCEAVMDAEFPRWAVAAFFDTDYFQCRDSEKTEAWSTVRLAGLAYSLTPDQGDAKSPGLTPRPWQEGHPDEYDFRGTVRSIAFLEAWDQAFYRLEVELLDSEAGAEGGTVPPLPIYLAGHLATPDFTPKTGDPVSGTLWLQGWREKSNREQGTCP